MSLSTHVLLLSVGLGACATVSPGSRPDDMSAAEHQATADSYETRAADHEARYDPAAITARPVSTASGGGRGEVDDGLTYREYNPTEQHLRHAEQFREHARQHSDAARTLEGFEHENCRELRKDVRAVCPLMGGVVEGVEDIEDGARLRISDDTETEAVAAHMRCHYAFGRKHGHRGMDACPLYLKGLEISVSGDHSVDIVTSESASVEEIRVRSKAHVDQ